ncbi:hypothetical protein NX871_25670 [Burkholderia thailandensis]|uniref:hypothetical protein n=1 Tax=Burkholderia thailandensis TaxID=57975 RepID=UPI0018E07050|nr:hypothetical protein [Burkholderia thailandensis]MCS6473309.1 hypothetical protein [Burkholderia thailandensis]
MRQLVADVQRLQAVCRLKSLIGIKFEALLCDNGGRGGVTRLRQFTAPDERRVRRGRRIERRIDGESTAGSRRIRRRIAGKLPPMRSRAAHRIGTRAPHRTCARAASAAPSGATPNCVHSKPPLRRASARSRTVESSSSTRLRREPR